jgi:hypothetical protein
MKTMLSWTFKVRGVLSLDARGQFYRRSTPERLRGWPYRQFSPLATVCHKASHQLKTCFFTVNLVQPAGPGPTADTSLYPPRARVEVDVAAAVMAPSAVPPVPSVHPASVEHMCEPRTKSRADARRGWGSLYLAHP